MNVAHKREKRTIRAETYKPTHLAKADLHNHLRTGSSMSGSNFFYNVVDKISKSLNPNGILGLINFEDSRYESFSNLPGYNREGFGNAMRVKIPSRTDFSQESYCLIVRGQEVPTKQGHLLVLGLKNRANLQSGMDLDYTLSKAKEKGGIIIADHPFHKDGIGPYLESLDSESRSKIINQFDALEVFNGEAQLWFPGYSYANQKAKEFYEGLPKDCEAGAISTSDGHTISEIGRCNTYLVLDKPITEIKDAEDVQETLRKAIRNSKLESGLKMRSCSGHALWHAAALFGYHVPKDMIFKNRN